MILGMLARVGLLWIANCIYLSHTVSGNLFIADGGAIHDIEGYSIQADFSDALTKMMGDRTIKALQFNVEFTGAKVDSLLLNINLEQYLLLHLIYSLQAEDFLYSATLMEASKSIIIQRDNHITKWFETNVHYNSDTVYNAAKYLVRHIKKDNLVVSNELSTALVEVFQQYKVFETACFKGELDVMTWFLETGYLPQAEELFFTAWKNSQISTIKTLFKTEIIYKLHLNKKNVQMRNRNNETLLHVAAELNQPKSVEALLTSGADPNAVDAEGFTPLYRAIRANSTNVIQYLLGTKSTFEKHTTHSGISILHVAVLYSSPSVVELLIKSGIPVDCKNKLGLTPLQIVEYDSVVALVNGIEDSGKYISSNLYDDEESLIKPSDSFWENVFFYMNSNEDMNLKIKPINLYHRSQIINILTSKGAKLNLQNSIHDKLLSIAKHAEYREGVQFLENIQDYFNHQSYCNINFNSLENGNLEINYFEMSTKNIPNINFTMDKKNVSIMLSNEVTSLNPTETIKLQNALNKFMEHTKVITVSLQEEDNNSNTSHTFTWAHLPMAALYGNDIAVHMILNKTTNLEDKLGDGWTALHLAAGNGYDCILWLLLEKGADLNARSDSNWTALHYAAANGHRHAVRQLLRGGAELEARTMQSWTALHLAVANGHTGVASLLLDKGAEPETVLTRGWTPLHIAARYDHKDILEILLEKGVDLEIQDIEGWRPLHLAARYGRAEVAQILLENGANLEARTKKGLTSLILAAINGNTGVVKLLLKKGSKLNRKVPPGWTALHFAAKYGHSEMVKELLMKGADFEAKTNDNWRPLHLAANEGHVEVVEELGKKGANLNSKTGTDGWTALHLAAKNGHFYVVQKLVKMGADMEVEGNELFRPLHLASRGGHVRVVQELLRNGANVNPVSDLGWTPLLLAVTHGHDGIVQELLEKEANLNLKTLDGWSPLHIAANSGYTGIVEHLLEKGANIEEPELEGFRPLHIAARNGFIQMVHKLLDKGADVNSATEGGWTALRLAAYFGNSEITKLVIGKGADLELADQEGLRALHIAAQGGHLEVVQDLIRKGADVTATSTTGQTPLQYAIENKHNDVVDLLRGWEKLKGREFPVHGEFRRRWFGSSVLEEPTAVLYLNGKDWFRLYKYVTEPYRYRALLVREYNF